MKADFGVSFYVITALLIKYIAYLSYFKFVVIVGKGLHLNAFITF